jgi:hypothetical protein
MKPSCRLIAALAFVAVMAVGALGGCARHDDVALKIPDFAVLDSAKTAEDYSRFLNTITIKPNRIRFSREELVPICTMLLQLDAVARSEKFGDVMLPENSDLYLALDTTLKRQPGWSVLADHGRAKGGVEVTSIVAFIQARFGVPKR